MRKQFEFSEEDLYLAAREAEQFIRAQYPDAQTCPPHTFSPAFEADMQQLFAQLQNGTLKTSAARLGWPYYLRRSIAAILLCFLLACATMPEAVLAGYQKLIEVVEHVFEEYTEYWYRSDVSNNTEFKPLKLGYLPEGMVEANRRENSNHVKAVYRNEQKKEYFVIYQEKVTEDDEITYNIDSEDAEREIIKIQNRNMDISINIISKESRLYFVCVYKQYHIMGQTNLEKEEMLKILRQIEI